MPTPSNYGAVHTVEPDDEPLICSCATRTHRQEMSRPTLEGASWAWITAIGALLALAFFLTGDNRENTGSLMGSPLYDENRSLFYHEQPIDHFDDENTETWSNRYFKSTLHFKGAGHPIFLVVGGEGALDHGMLYPFVTDVLAERFGAAVLQIEHRFYGPYRPIENATTAQLENLLTPGQAMADMVQLTRHVRDSKFVDCSPDRSSLDYCPIITVGGSYPGFLSAMLRIVHGDFVDISYASSAPLLMYAQISDQNSYYDIVTDASDRASPGCSTAVRTNMNEMVDRVYSSASLREAATSIGVCSESIPTYISSKHMLSEAIIEILSYAFADYDMTNYPPGPDTGLSKACRLFQNDRLSTKDTLSLFFQRMVLSNEEEGKGCDVAGADCDQSFLDFEESCFDLTSQLPDGPKSTLEDTGGDYKDGSMWDFQTCTDVIFLAGFSETSLFPPHRATLKHLTEHCRARFGVTPHPTEMVDTWDFMNKLKSTSHIIFVNGMQDMWAGGSILSNVSDTVVAINLENGAHHSAIPPGAVRAGHRGCQRGVQ